MKEVTRKWLDWRESERAKVEREPSGTDTRQAEEEDKTMVEGISEAIATEIPRFAMRSTTRSFSQLVPGSPQSRSTHCAARAGIARQSNTT